MTLIVLLQKGLFEMGVGVGGGEGGTTKNCPLCPLYSNEVFQTSVSASYLLKIHPAGDGAGPEEPRK